MGRRLRCRDTCLEHRFRERKNDDPHGPISNYYAPEPSSEEHIALHASERDMRPLLTTAQNQDQSQQTSLKRKREDSPLPAYDPSSENVRWKHRLGARSEDFAFQRRLRGKTVSQVMQMLRVEEARKSNNDGDGDVGEEDGTAGERAGKRVW